VEGRRPTPGGATPIRLAARLGLSKSRHGVRAVDGISPLSDRGIGPLGLHGDPRRTATRARVERGSEGTPWARCPSG